jgi:hypothetical protein
MRIPADPDNHVEEKCIIHEAVMQDSKQITAFIVETRREALLERITSTQVTFPTHVPFPISWRAVTPQQTPPTNKLHTPLIDLLRAFAWSAG